MATGNYNATRFNPATTGDAGQTTPLYDTGSAEEWLFGPNSIWNFMFGPQSLVGGLTAPRPPQDPNTPVGGRQGDFDPRITPNQIDPYLAELREYHGAGLIPDHEFFQLQERLVNSLNLGYDELQTLMDYIRGRADYTRQTNDYNTAQARFETARTGALSDIDRIQGEFDPILKARVEGLRNLYITDPTTGAPTDQLSIAKVRSSQQYGNMLAAAEGAINRDVEQGRRTAQLGQVSRGVAGSGKLQAGVRAIEQAGAEGRGRLFRDLPGLVGGDLASAEQNYMNFLNDVSARRRAVEGGDLGSALSLGQYAQSLADARPSSFEPLGTGLDVTSLRVGNQRADVGLLINALLGAAGIAQDGMSSATSLLGGFLPGGG